MSGRPHRRIGNTALAAIFHGSDKPMELREFALPTLQPGEPLVALTYCTIYGNDLHTIRGYRPVSGPTILGHEMIGRIAELSGDESLSNDVRGDPLAIGDRVTWSVAASCGSCLFCNKGLPQTCDRLFTYGHEATDQSALSSGLTAFCHLVRGTAIVKVSETLADHVACPAICATATVARAVRIADDCETKSVLIHGEGMLGLTAAAMAATQGAAPVMVSDLSEPRLARASTFGATHMISSVKIIRRYQRPSAMPLTGEELTWPLRHQTRIRLSSSLPTRSAPTANSSSSVRSFRPVPRSWFRSRLVARCGALTDCTTTRPLISRPRPIF